MRKAERGFALLIVFWTLALLSLVVTGLIASGRGEVKLVENLRNGAVAEAAADGAADEAIFHLVAGQWGPGLMPYRLRIGDASVAVRIEDESGKVNPNDAPRELMAALLRNVGLDSRAASVLAAAIDGFHQPLGGDVSQYRAAGLPYGPTHRPFREVAELRQVVGMTPALYERLAPHLSVWTTPMMSVPAADPVVARSFREAGANGGYPSGFPSPMLLQQLGPMLIVRITAIASYGGAQFTRQVVAEVDGEPDPSDRPPPYTIYWWGRTED